MTRYLVTSALPYANGPIHFGHIIGAYLPADVYTRYRRMRGDEVMFVCGTDEHGVAITINAEAQNKEYGEFVKHWHDEIKSTFDAFNIQFDIFSGTSSCKPHREISQQFFTNLNKNEYLNKKTEKQWYCETHQMFLADRYLEGTCPFCGAENARGDECKKCGQWIDALALKNAKCKLCGNAPIVKDTEHWYLKLPEILNDGFGAWFEGKDTNREHVEWKSNVKAFVANMLKDLHERPITRDLRWGVPVPLPNTDGKVLYVWFDAPIGYCSMTQELLEKRGTKDKNAWLDWWAGGENTKIIHFIGKDNIGFHTIVFPAMLFGQKAQFGKQMNLPWAVPAMEFYNLQGRKFSTSDGWTIDPKEFLQKFPNVDALRFALLATAPETSDSEFTFEEYQRINNDLLADKIGNLVSRVLKIAIRDFGSEVGPMQLTERALKPVGSSHYSYLLMKACFDGTNPEMVSRILDAARYLSNDETASSQTSIPTMFQFRIACLAPLILANATNEFIDEQKPWKQILTDRLAAEQSIAAALYSIAVIGVLIRPIMPETSDRIFDSIGVSMTNISSTILSHFDRGKLSLTTPTFRISGTPILFPKLDEKVILAEIESLKSRSKKMENTNNPAPSPATPAPVSAAPAPAAAVTDPNAPKPEITYEDFTKCEFRVGTVVEASRVPKADKLLQLQIDIGREKRQIVAGIAGKYAPEELVGKRVVVVCNLAPRKLRGVESQGMVLAADDGSGPVIISPSTNVNNGATVK